MPEPAERPLRVWPSESLILATAPFLGYLVTLLNERGFLSHFEAPTSVIHLDATLVITAAVTLVAATNAVFLVAYLVLGTLRPLRSTVLITYSAVLGGAALYALGEIYIYRSHWRGWLPSVALLAVLAVLLLGFPLVGARGTKGFLPKLEAAWHRRRERPSVLGEAISRNRPLATTALLLTVVTLVASGFAWSMGRASAMRQEHFLVPAALPDVAVLRMYGTSVVGVRFDRDTHRTTGTFVFWARNDPRRSVLKRERIGPLKPA